MPDFYGLKFKGVKNVKKKYEYICCLLPVLAITFLLASFLGVGINNTNAEEVPLANPSSTQHELNKGVDDRNQSISNKTSLLDVPDIGEYQSTLVLILSLAGNVLVEMKKNTCSLWKKLRVDKNLCIFGIP
jgi:hypothetical protein